MERRFGPLRETLDFCIHLLSQRIVVLKKRGFMRKNSRGILFAAVLTLFTPFAMAGGKDVPVPGTCTPNVNRGLQELIRSHTRRDVDNIMVCGIATQHSRVQSGGRHGSHHIIPLTVNLPDDGQVQVQVVINDSLDGPVSANANDKVFAYGQGYIAHGPWAAGVHDVHCSTHAGADNGWVVINGNKTPNSCPGYGSR
jgi:hypothetical protein